MSARCGSKDHIFINGKSANVKYYEIFGGLGEIDRVKIEIFPSKIRRRNIHEGKEEYDEIFIETD